MKNQSISSNLDWISVAIYILLVILGWLNIYSSSLSSSVEDASLFDFSQIYGKQMLFILFTIPLIFIILAVLMITLSLQTKLGEKVSILVDRLMELWNGKEEKKGKGKNGNGNVKVSQPISGQSGSITGQVMPQSQSTYTDGTSINSLPTADVAINVQQQQPDFDKMYRQDTNPLVNANMPGQVEGFSEPMAANSVLGGGSFSSW